MASDDISQHVNIVDNDLGAGDLCSRGILHHTMDGNTAVPTQPGFQIRQTYTNVHS
jgi:hypothetical protein